MTQSSMSIHPFGPLRPCLEQHERVDVRAWRLCWLIDAGFERVLADRLAGDPSIDLHALLELVDRGCPPALAARILGPVDASAAER
jgi:hypothetical protein